MYESTRIRKKITDLVEKKTSDLKSSTNDHKSRTYLIDTSDMENQPSFQNPLDQSYQIIYEKELQTYITYLQKYFIQKVAVILAV